MCAQPAPAPARTGALLVLEDGRTFRGESYGAPGETFGEAVFATGMSGYEETLTDPSYHRQVVVMTAPHIGNTGITDEDAESSRIWVAGYVVRDPARRPSSWRSRRSLHDALRDQGVVGISGVDTRALTRHLRERGAMRVGISSTETNPEALLARVRQSTPMTGANLSAEVTTTEPYVVKAGGNDDSPRFRVAALDLGIKANTPRMLAERGIETHVLPATASLDDVLAVRPDGLFFSNGPGDPAATTGQIELLRAALERGIPYFGICFGNQLFGRALGFGTYKLTYGHRGINQPVMDRTTGKVEVTAHNHGFAVDAPLDEPTPTPYGVATVSHVCLNDDVVEGLELRDDEGRLKAFSVQYHPEAAAGPHDAAYLFDRFVSLVEESRHGEPSLVEEGRPGPSRNQRDRTGEAGLGEPSLVEEGRPGPSRNQRDRTGEAGLGESSLVEEGRPGPSRNQRDRTGEAGLVTGASAPSSTSGESQRERTGEAGLVTGASAPSSTSGESQRERTSGDEGDL